jgi:hypothetical protein
MKLVREYEYCAEHCRKLEKSALKQHRLAIAHMAEMWARLAAERKKAVANDKDKPGSAR